MRMHITGGDQGRLGRSLRPAAITATVVVGLALVVGAQAETPIGRRVGEPMVVPMTVTSSERAATLARAAALAADLGIPGTAGRSARTFHVADLRVVDETELTDARGRPVAVVRTDERGALRSIVRLDWTAATGQPLVDQATAAGHARRQARMGGLTVPTSLPGVSWDAAMDAWRVEWRRRIDGAVALGDGLTVWIHRGGQLAALRRSETATAAAPLERVEASAAAEAARAWVDRRGGAPAAPLVAPELVWVRPNDFVGRGGADDTDALMRLAYRVDLTLTLPGGSHRVALFVDAGSGLVIAGAESA